MTIFDTTYRYAKAMNMHKRKERKQKEHFDRERDNREDTHRIPKWRKTTTLNNKQHNKQHNNNQ